MGKTGSPSDVLKNILRDVSNIENIIHDSKEFEKNTYDKVNFDNAQEVEEIIKATKVIVDSLKAEAVRIHTYFETNYSSWNLKLNITEESNVDGSDLCDTVVNDVAASQEITVTSKNDDKEINDNSSTASENVNIDGTDSNVNKDAADSNVNKDATDSNVNKDATDSNVNKDATDSNVNKDATDCNVNKDATDSNVKDEEEKDERSEEPNDNENECHEKIDQIKEEETAGHKNLNEDESANKNATSEPKMFLKCVDINKLINPDIIPHLISPTPLRDDSEDILIISDSDDDCRKPKQKKDGRTLRTRFQNPNRSKRFPRNSKKKSKKCEPSDVHTISSDTDGGRPLSSKSNLRSNARTKKKYKEPSVSSNSSCDSESSVDKQSSRTLKTYRKTSSANKRKPQLDIKKDVKLNSRSYVSVLRISCEKLKEYYLNQKEILEVARLTNMSSLKKRNHSGRLKVGGGNDSSSEDSKVQSKKKRKRKSSKSSNSGDSDTELEDTVDSSVPNIATGTAAEENETALKDTVNDLLDQMSEDSDNDKSSSEGEKEKKKETKDNEKSSSENKNKSSSKHENGDQSKQTNAKEVDDNESTKSSDESSKGSKSDDSTRKKKKKKSSWRRDKLLTAKLSDTDSENELEKLKNKNKTRLGKKKTKKVINSDSDDDSKNESNDVESTKSSSSSSDSEKHNKNKSKKHSRIKRVNDSSEDDADKSTRRTIRKVIAHESLAETTKRAEKEERERKQRILERQKKYNKIFDGDKPADATIDKVVLDFNEETNEEILSVNKDIVKNLKPHQGKGVQFMWNACYESVARAKTTDGSGCILAHCMGLGKTLQVIALTHTLLTNEDTGVAKVLVVCPLSTVLNWTNEYKKWLDNVDGPTIDVYELVSIKQSGREFIVDDWHRDGGVLIMGYDMFRNIANPDNKRIKKRARESFQKGLVNPGPDLVICDEGHLLKNEKSHISVAMCRLRTARRIVLTGTPMQNNLKEYYCMVQFVKPNLLGTYKEYINRFVNPITNGQYTDSTSHDINIMRKRSHVLHKLLDGVVQSKDYHVLMPFLPPKYEFVLFLTLTETQIKLYQHYKDNFSQKPEKSKIKSSFLFSDFQEFQRICTHPRVLLLKTEEQSKKLVTSDEEEDSEGSLKDFIDDESEGKTTSDDSCSDSDKSTKSTKSKSEMPQKRLTRTSAAASGIGKECSCNYYFKHLFLLDIDEIISETKDTGGGEWWRDFCDGDELDNIELSSKLYLLFQILQECELIGDKLLVFSQSLYSLNIIEYFLSKIDDATQQGDSSKVSGFSGSWTLGLDYFRMDGSSSCTNRSAWCKSFNSDENPRARLFLISTRAGGLGINLVGANRVIIFDVSWNPSHDTQSIYRVYRFGQTKPCYIYRFVIWGAMEMKIYERQVTKQAISKRVIDEQQIDRHYNQSDLCELYAFEPKPVDQVTPLVPKDVLLAEMLQKEKERIYKYHEHQSLLENKQDEQLNEEERKIAWEEFENEKTARVTDSGMLTIRDIPLPYINIALSNILRRDHPTWSSNQLKEVLPKIVEQVKAQVEAGVENMLFQRIIFELKQIEAIRQRKYQEKMLQLQRQQQMRLVQHLRNQMYSNPNEIVEIND
ncbi:hypothetical protein FQA39_LY03453 [Lamprigera yunnana]|nr:hypothetical protein FQA39_LY03453 [Lamprigera yunnana]